MTYLRMPNEAVFTKQRDITVFNQLAAKVVMDLVSNDDYFAWLTHMSDVIGKLVPGAQIVEKVDARLAPPLNTAVYYDTECYDILPTGALLRTSCNRITHAFCAFKLPQDEHSVRRDHRYVFEGDEKSIIQRAPASTEAVNIVRSLLARRDIEHPGIFLERHYGIRPEGVRPAICLEDYRYTFYVWLDAKDILRCSLDRAHVTDLRKDPSGRERRPFSEVEIALYPRIDPGMAGDPRVVDVMRVLIDSLCSRFGVAVTTAIKYQRAAAVLGLPG